jgi:hypothetical protein
MTKNALTTQNNNAPMMSFGDMEQAANFIVEGKLFPQWNTVPKVMTLMLLCKSEGIDPISAINRYDNINGRIAKKSQSILGDFLAIGGKVEWLECNEEKARGKFTTPDGVEHIEEFNMDDARRAGLVKPGSGWVKYPKAMLRARCITFALRAVYPQSLNMMLSSEEAQDIVASPTRETSANTIEEPSATTTTPIIETKVVEEPPHEPSGATSTIEEFLDSLPAKKLNGFLKSINWGTRSKLTDSNIIAIDANREGFAEKVLAFQ